MKSSNHIEKLLSAAIKRLEEAGVDNPSLDAEVLLAHIIDTDRLQLPLLDDAELSAENSKKFEDVIKRRSEHEPVAYIINKKEFYSREFYVDENVLIPRPDTEILVETAVEVIQENWSQENPVNILEIGTGSGIISYLLAEFIPNARITATDISDQILEIARKNCASKKFSSKIEFVKSDLFSAFDKAEYKNHFHVIISNPPYISESDYPHLQKDITDYEPREALIGGETGIEFSKELFQDGFYFLNEKGIIVIETGYDLEPQIKEIVDNLNVDSSIEFLKDLQNIPRVAVITKTKH